MQNIIEFIRDKIETYRVYEKKLSVREILKENINENN